MNWERKISDDEYRWLQRLPKAELHLHLEGAIPLPALHQLIRKYGGTEDVADVTALRERLRYRDFSHFIETWVWKNDFLREYEDFTLIGTAVAKDLAEQNIRYVEAFYSPRDFARHGLEVQPLTAAIRRGLDAVPEVEVALVADLIRDFGPECATRTLAELAEVRDLGVVGVGIGGREQCYPPEPFVGVYRQAREMSFRTSAHAGEAAGPESIWGAVRVLQVDRIGHGTRAVEDPALMDHLAEKHVPVELCPLSNVCTGVLQSIEEHPIREYLRRGMTVCVNTDDPQMFHNTLADEYAALRGLGLSVEEVRQLICNGVTVSWLPDERKKSLLESFRADPAWCETRL